MGLWLPDQASYLADLTHPLAKREDEAYRQELGLRYGEPMSERQRRELDRRVVAKYGGKYPPPGRAHWLLQAYDILDAQDERVKNKTAG